MTKEEILEHWMQDADGNYRMSFTANVKIPKEIVNGDKKVLRHYVVQKLNALQLDLATKIFNEVKRLL